MGTKRKGNLEVGSIYQSKYYGDMEVIEDLHSLSVTVKFVDTNTLVEGIQRSNVRSGKVKDPSQKSRAQDSHIKQGENTYNSYLRLVDTRKGWAIYHCTLCGKKEHKTAKKYSEYNIPQSCGCINKLKPKEDVTGSVIQDCLFIGYRDSGYWLVEYPCGCRYFRTKYQVTSRRSVLCGDCREVMSPTFRHGMNGTPTHNSWLNLRRRCMDENNNRFQYYGENGITVCERWLDSFENFLEDMGECPKDYSLERKDILKGYDKDNCIWADNKTQANNKSNNILITNSNEVMSLKHWCDIEGVDYKRAHYLYKYKGCDVSVILGENYRLAKDKFDI